MARGGARPGAGRPKGSKKATNKSVATADKTLANADPSSVKYKTALDFAMATINDPSADIADKIRLAVAAMPFQHPKLEPRTQGKKDERQDAAKQASKGKFGSIAPPRLVANNKQ